MSLNEKNDSGVGPLKLFVPIHFNTYGETTFGIFIYILGFWENNFN